MPIMRSTGLVAILLAWAALQLPWEHCHSDCHGGHVVPALGEHHCHEEECGQASSESEKDHERVDFPASKPGPPLERALMAAPTHAPEIERGIGPCESEPVGVLPSPGRLSVVVLLL
jgi:hypothetical protein